MNIKTNKHEYIEQIGCHMCKHCFKHEEYDDIERWYCNLDGDRPVCGSVGMNERFDKSKRRQQYYAWEKWAEEHAINPWGICKKWEETTYEEECALQGVEA